MNIDVTALRIYNVIKHCAIQHRTVIAPQPQFEQCLLEQLDDFPTCKWSFYGVNISLQTRVFLLHHI